MTDHLRTIDEASQRAMIAESDRFGDMNRVGSIDPKLVCRQLNELLAIDDQKALVTQLAQGTGDFKRDLAYDRQVERLHTLTAAGAPHAGKWLQCHPTTNTFHIPSNAFRVAVLARTGFTIQEMGLLINSTQTVTCGCKARKVALTVIHAMNCATIDGNRAYTRHNQIRNLFNNALRGCTTRRRLEPTGIQGFDGRERPDLLFKYDHSVSNYEQKFTYLLDFSIAGAISQQMTSKAKRQAICTDHLVLAKARVKQKAENVEGKHLHKDYKFRAICFESFGGFHEDAVKLIETIGKTSQGNFRPELQTYQQNTFTNYYVKAISVALARYGAENIINAVRVSCGAQYEFEFE